ncbi:glycosyltransferase 87 family protein [Actinophytocola algeriensis]|uniref:Alpha-1,2-mannosyltransferase n=1 Tax=Actinophytocola algeriensis TaxID=1768010 RepID=A0A7W7VHD2_9PSEU|nr:glycosyltransferase 87 family protein [Actinophytocola algeriensis]MBB4910306.1 alpha-1,2-mannosyltransferase [Actinophytocola algeriensis]MBE1480705.1 alpha-1,2-mannosyltransferase [Actinophytocola algeriensis]
MARRSGVLAVGGACLVAAAVLLLLVDWANFMDLRVYRAGGQAFIDGFGLYSDGFGREYGTGLPFTYPPVAAMLFTTLAVVPVAVAVAVFTAVSLGALAAVAVMVVRRPVTLVAAAFAFGVVLEPVRLTLSFGQINLVLMVLVVADCLLPRMWWPRGTLIGLAAAVKLTPFAFLLYFAAHRRWRPVVTAVGAFAAVSLLVWALAPEDTPAYLSTVLGDPTKIGGLTYTGNQSLNGFWHRLGLGDTLTTALWLASALVVAALGWVAVRRARVAGDDLGALLAAATAGLLASPVSWSHHWVWAMLAGAWLVPRLRGWRWPGRIAAVAGLLVFVAPPHWVLPNRYDRELNWSWWQHVVGNEFTWLGLALLVTTAVVSSRRRTPAACRERVPRS